MSDLFDTKIVEFSHGISQERCKTIIFRVTQDQVKYVEKSRHLQAKISKWDYFRSGRITYIHLFSSIKMKNAML